MHLSIGDALDRLKGEFPDITISKIRFFEGQGLIGPERTPSGYRKFTSIDIQRLRWVLQQQQEAYLPLKVLRERMAAAEASGVVPVTRRGELPEGLLEVPIERRGTTATARPSQSGASSDYDPALGSLDDLDFEGDLDDFDLDDDIDDIDDVGGALDEALQAALGRTGSRVVPSRGRANSITDAGVRSAAPSDATAETMGEFRHPAARARSVNLRPASTAATSAASHPSSRPRQSASSTGAAGSALTAPSARAIPHGASASLRSAGTAPVSPGSSSAGRSVATSQPLGSNNPMLGASGGAPMAFHELASASGLSLDDLRLLEEFGLVTGRQMFDGKYYDEEALTVALTVVAFRDFGVEPRHLRMYKTSADREASFFAQVVSPTLHRRGDDAKAKAAATIAELRRLGDLLHEIALGQALRDVLDGR